MATYHLATKREEAIKQAKRYALEGNRKAAMAEVYSHLRDELDASIHNLRVSTGPDLSECGRLTDLRDSFTDAEEELLTEAADADQARDSYVEAYQFTTEEHNEVLREGLS